MLGSHTRLLHSTSGKQVQTIAIFEKQTQKDFMVDQYVWGVRKVEGSR